MIFPIKRLVGPAIILVLTSCAVKTSQSVRNEELKPGEPPQDIMAALPLEPVVEVEGRDIEDAQDSDADTATQSVEKTKIRAPVVGIWIDSVALDAFWALGFMQELDKSGVKISKVVGQGFGCWVASSWAQEGSANQAEWQSFKWSNWEHLSLDPGFLKRLTGSRANYESFAQQIERWIEVEEFNAMKLSADCPLVDARASYALRSAHSVGVKRALWFQMRQPFFVPPMEPQKTDAYLSAWAFGGLRPEDYDRFSRDSGQNVDFWIHLRTVPAGTWAQEDPWLIATAHKDEWGQESWLRTPEGRWVLKKTLYDRSKATKSNVLDFARRREFLLEGRKLGRRWIDGEWFQNNLRDSFSAQ